MKKEEPFKLNLEKINTSFFSKYSDSSINVSWNDEIARYKKKYKLQALKLKIKSFLHNPLYRSPNYVEDYYKNWTKYNLKYENPEEDKAYLAAKLKDKYFCVNKYGQKRATLLKMIELIKQLKPKNVLEVGSGVGIYPLLLSCVFPEIKFTGLELTKEGVEASKDFQNLKVLPEHWKNFIPHKLADLSGFKKAKFIQASCLDIPYKENTFDLVYSCLAMEQMDNIKYDAIKEIRRVTKKNVSFIEPFYDKNKNSPQKEYIYVMNYFKGEFEDIRKAGFKEIYKDAEYYPQKPYMNVSHYVAEKI